MGRSGFEKEKAEIEEFLAKSKGSPYVI